MNVNVALEPLLFCATCRLPRAGTLRSLWSGKRRNVASTARPCVEGFACCPCTRADVAAACLFVAVLGARGNCSRRAAVTCFFMTNFLNVLVLFFFAYACAPASIHSSARHFASAHEILAGLAFQYEMTAKVRQIFGDVFAGTFLKARHAP